MNKYIFIVAKLIAIQLIIVKATVVFAQNSQASMHSLEPANIVQLSANASVDVRQDILTINMSTTREATDANLVQTQLKNALDIALTEAKKTSQAGQLEVRTGNFSLYPRHGRDGKINGWQGTTELVLEGRDFAKISATAGKIQTLTIANATFGLSREQRQKVESEAQALAIERYRAKATDIAKSFGMTSYSLREITVNAGDQGFRPRTGMVSAMAMRMESVEAPVPVEAGISTVVVTVSGSIQLR